MDIRCETFYFDSANGLNRVFVRRWLPQAQACGVVQLAHGLAEHSGRYDELAVYLAGRGFIVVAHDHIGHGLSVEPGQRYGFFARQGGWDFALRDMEYLRATQQGEDPNLPYFMLGHSMGSFLLRSYLIKYASSGLSGAIISGSGQMPPLTLKLGGLLIGMERRRLGAQGISPVLNAAILGSFNRRFSPRRTAVDWLSRDNAMVDNYLADPLCRKLPTVGLYGDIYAAIRDTIRSDALRRMEPTLPVLFIAGERDPVGHNGKSVWRLQRAFSRAGCADVQLKLYPNARHALHYEQNRAEVFGNIDAWLKEKMSEKGARL